MCFLVSGFSKKALNTIVKQGDEAEKNVPPAPGFNSVHLWNTCGITEGPQFPAIEKQVLELPGKLFHILLYIPTCVR